MRAMPATSTTQQLTTTAATVGALNAPYKAWPSPLALCEGSLAGQASISMPLEVCRGAADDEKDVWTG
jgi:hypothetical protein